VQPATLGSIMGPTAAIVFFAFILLGYTLERRRKEQVTRALWLPLFWMIVCASRSVGQWLNLSSPLSGASLTEASLGGSLADQIVLSIAIVCGIIVLKRRKEATLWIIKNNKALIAFTIYLGITALWSDISAVSFKRWVRLSGNVIMAAVVMSEPEPFEALRSLFRRTAYLLIPLSVMFIKFFPHIGILYTRLGNTMWVGATLMKNGLGHLLLVCLFFCPWDMAAIWRENIEGKFQLLFYEGIITLVCLWLLSGTYSAAAIGCLIIGLAAWVVFQCSYIKRNFTHIGVILVACAILFVSMESAFGIVDAIVTSLGRNMTFTDRVPMWDALIELGMKKAFLGYGYEGFWILDRSYIDGLSQAHSGFLELFVEGGMVAIILFAVFLMSVVKNIQKSGVTEYQSAVFRLCFLIMILVANITESALARERDLLSFVFFVISLDYPNLTKYFIVETEQKSLNQTLHFRTDQPAS
jgi:exopolysaccharide production protein ExoQ